jgi:hypothetical protein
MRISKYLILEDCTKSQTAIRLGINNTPNNEQLQQMMKVAALFDKVKDVIPYAEVSSFFRSDRVNRAIGGAIGSQHAKGQAIDIDSSNNAHNRMIFEFIKDNLEFDQLIFEFGNDINPDWVHVSFSDNPRKQVLRAKKVGKKTVYEPYR